MGSPGSTRFIFLARLLVFFLIFYFAWHMLTPLYNRALAPAALLLVKASEIGGLHLTRSLQPEGEYIFVQHLASVENPESAVRIKTRVIHFDLVLLSALIWTVPKVSRKKRVKILLAGLAILFPLHLVKILLFVKHEYSLHIQIDGVQYWSPFLRSTYKYLADFIVLIANQVVPVVIWSLLYVNLWWRKSRIAYVKS